MFAGAKKWSHVTNFNKTKLTVSKYIDAENDWSVYSDKYKLVFEQLEAFYLDKTQEEMVLYNLPLKIRQQIHIFSSKKKWSHFTIHNLNKIIISK